MERMNGVMNVREAELKEVIKINHEEIAYWKNKANNAEAELDQVKRENKRLEEENKKLREELEWYKKQYEHSMGEDEGKLVKGGYASFNEYGELMEEDTLQELREIGKI